MANETLSKPQFQTVDHADGSREFILSARRNFQEKISFSICLLIIGGFFAVIEYALSQFNDLPAWLSFFTVGWFRNSMRAVLVPVLLILIYAVLNMWLRSSRIFVRPGETSVVTHWLFLKRTQTVPLSRIMEVRPENNASDGGILYYDLVVIAVPEKPGRHRIDTDPNTGGKRIIAAANIKGKEEAEHLLQKINEILLS